MHVHVQNRTYLEIRIKVIDVDMTEVSLQEMPNDCILVIIYKTVIHHILPTEWNVFGKGV